MRLPNFPGIVALLLLSPAFAQAAGTDTQPPGSGPVMLAGGMMGSGMMGGGMMSPSSNGDQAAPVSVNSKQADALLAYIRNNNLPCTRCHDISRSGYGPSFAEVAAHYANERDATTALTDHIENGYGGMPGGLTTDSEARDLARMILSLAKSGNP